MFRLLAGLLFLAAPLPPVAAAASASRSATFTVSGSLQAVDVTGARPGERMLLLDRRGRVLQSMAAGALGGIVFRDVKAGPGYRVRAQQGGPSSSAAVVLPDRSAPPSTKLYDQRIPSSGYGYLTTRDGTKLAIDVHTPGGPGPHPTLVEYSGYGYANPAGAEASIGPIATLLLGYTVVDVNMRGTGCSGGAYDFFDRPQSLDGYDVIETVARQPWVLHHRVGMMGISYGGISQLFVAATDPPHLAAITPLSVIDSVETTLYPGGILNTGFALTYAKDRIHAAEPASPTGGQPWALDRIRQGDLTCKENQVLHTAAVNLVAKIRANRYYNPSVADPLAPVTFVDKIRAPVFLACQWEDEQTGGHCADLAEHFTGTRHKWFTFANGLHIDSIDPATLQRWSDFLDLFVAGRTPRPSPQAAAAHVVWETAMGISGQRFPYDPIQHEPTYGAALAAFQRSPAVRILFDNGAGGSTPGSPVAGFERSFKRFPLPGTRARSWYLGPHGTLTDTGPPRAGRETFTWNRSARPATDFHDSYQQIGGPLWGTSPGYNWLQNPPRTGLSYLTAPLKRNTVIVGAGALHAWIRSSTPDVDLQVTISEVRPDGKETYVQDGWLRASFRKLDPAKSTLLEPWPSGRRSDVARLPRGRFSEVIVPLYYEGHVYRARSRVRITIEAPGGDQPTWSFSETTPRGRAKVTVAYSRSMPSRLILPLVPGIAVPTALPPCPGLRGEPCRSFR